MAELLVACGPAVADGEDTIGSVRMLGDGSLVVAVEREGETTTLVTFPADAVAPALADWFRARRVA